MKTEIYIVYRLFDYENDFKWKTLNYKVVDLVESYNFHIKFTPIRVQTKKLQFFEKRLHPYRRDPQRQEGATVPRASYRRGARR
jgi:hypothetical protein